MAVIVPGTASNNINVQVSRGFKVIALVVLSHVPHRGTPLMAQNTHFFVEACRSPSISKEEALI
jgi:hypothetical protein